MEKKVKKYFLKEDVKLQEIKIKKGYYEGSSANFGSSIEVSLGDRLYCLPKDFFDMNKTREVD